MSREQVPSQEDIDRWPLMSHVVSSLQPGVDLLIGNNVPKATEPWEVINYVNDGPYAVLTVLGRSINGPLRSPTGSDDWSQAVPCQVQVTSRLEDQNCETILSPRVLWAVESDSLGCHVSIPDKAVTRQGQWYLQFMTRWDTGLGRQNPS